MSDRTPRERAETNLSDSLNVAGYGHAQATAIAGVGWAVLDLADAIRETRRPRPQPCQDEGPREATSRCVRFNGHDGEHADDTGGTWPS